MWEFVKCEETYKTELMFTLKPVSHTRTGLFLNHLLPTVSCRKINKKVKLHVWLYTHLMFSLWKHFSAWHLRFMHPTWPGAQRVRLQLFPHRDDSVRL